MSTTGASGPVLFAYDGSDLAKLAIEEAGRQLVSGRDALVVTVWQPFDLGFVPDQGQNFDAAEITDVRAAAAQTAAAGAALAVAAGFRAQSAEVEATPAWQGIVDLADEHDAGLIVLGSHGGRVGLARLLIGSVASAVASHSKRSVLIVHGRS